MDISQSDLEKLLNKKIRVQFYPKDLDIIYSASQKNPDLGLQYFGIDAFNDLMIRIGKAVLNEDETGEEIDLLTLTAINVILLCATNEGSRKAVIDKIGIDEYNASLKRVSDYLEAYMKK